MRTAAITITDGAPGSPQSVALSGTGITSGPNATLSPTSMHFAYVSVFNECIPPAAQPATLTNFGSETLSITSITITGFGFSETNTCGPSLGSGESCDITVSFGFFLNGTFSGELDVTDNAPDSPQMVTLTGTRSCFQ